MNQSPDGNASMHKELRHRGEALVAYPDVQLWNAVGGERRRDALIQDLYRRIEQDELRATETSPVGSPFQCLEGGTM